MSSPNNNDQFKLTNLYNVTDKVAVITGGGSGIGLMHTQALAVNGAKVYIIGRTMEKLQKVAEQYGKDVPGKIIPVQGDVSKKDSIKEIFSTISSKESHIDILINNAGVSSATFQTEAKTAEEMKANLFDKEEAHEKDWLDVYAVNVPQIYLMSTAFLPLLQKASETRPGWSGTIINVTSISGIVKSSQHHYAYNASKAAANHLTTMLANDIQQNGLKIRVNAIAPGVYPSEMTAGESDENQKSFIPAEKYQEKVPAGRPGNDRDMGNAVIFAVTNQYLNGQIVPVDGGYIIRHGAGA